MNRAADPAVLAEVVAKQEIAHAIATLQRGIDRRAAGLMKSAFHGDADVDYGFFVGPAVDFCDLMSGGPAPAPQHVTMHRPSNVWIKVHGERAISESYVFVYAPRSEPGGEVQALIGGRYLDRHERRNDEWRLSHRTYVLDWNTNRPGTGTALSGFQVPYARGLSGAEDPGVRLLDSWGIAESRTPEQSGSMEISEALAAKAELAFARSEIHELIMAQARATDRADEALLRSLWHPDATVDMGAFFTGAADAYCGVVLDAVGSLVRVAHTVANEWVQVAGDRAVAESYVIAIGTTADDGGDMDRLSGGRYLDRFACIDGAWRFEHRAFVQDWVIEQPTTDQRDDPDSIYASLANRGSRYPDDPIYAFWKY